VSNDLSPPNINCALRMVRILNAVRCAGFWQARSAIARARSSESDLILMQSTPSTIHSAAPMVPVRMGIHPATAPSTATLPNGSRSHVGNNNAS
jgi:hypothetical protein